MRGASRAPAVSRLLRALSRRDDGPDLPEPPRRWSPDGSVAAALAARVVSAPGLAAVGRALDRAASGLVSIPPRALLFVPAAWAAVRLAVGDGLPGGAGAVMLATAGLILLLHSARALFCGEGRRTVLRLLLLGAVLRVALGLAVSVGGGFPDERAYYHPLAADTAACWARGGESLLPGHPVVENRGTYFLLLSSTYFLFGSDLAVGRALGGLVGLLVALLAAELARLAGGRRAAAVTLGLLALHPEHALWSITLSRDSLNAAFVLAGLLFLVRARGRLLPLGLCLAAIPVMLLREGFYPAAVILGATAVLLTFAEGLAPGPRPVWRAARALAVLLLIGAGLYLLAHRYGEHLRWDVLSFARRGLDMSPLASGNPVVNDFLPGLSYDGLLGALAYLPLGAAFVLAAPWPWDAVHPARAVYAIFEVPGLAITLLGIVGTVVAVRARPARFAAPALFALLYLAALALLEGASGIVPRHRLALTATLAVGAGVLLAGLCSKRDP